MVFQPKKWAPGHAYGLNCLDTSHVAGTDADLHFADYGRIPHNEAAVLYRWNTQARKERAGDL